MGNLAKERNELFNKLIAENTKKKCLQIGVKEDIGAKFGSNWVSVDQFDMRDFIDFHYDIHDLKFVDSEFDVVVCISILEHIPYPEKAIKELHRVLRPGGEIWVQLPFHFPYHEAPKDYWRASPDGLRIWMKDFNEILCGSFLFTRTSLVTSTFFYGTKPE
jgi:SAM-dependent methyltransferase